MVPDPAIAPAAATSPLRIPIFRAVWLASIVSSFGGLIQSVGASWLMISMHAPPQMITLVQASTTLPVMLLALLAGAIADNFDRRRVMLCAQFFMLGVSALLAAFAWAGWLTPWGLLAFTFLVGCGTALNGPAWQASVGDLVPKALLPGAVTFNSMGFNIARSLGPAIGGAIVAVAGAAAAFLANAFSYVALITVLLRWTPTRPARALPSEAIGSAMVAGIRYVAMSPGVRTILSRSLVFGVGASAVPALTPLVARDLVAGGPFTFGMLLGGFGFGAIAGAMTSIRLRARLAPEAIVRFALLALILGTIVIALSRIQLISVIGMMLAGGGWVLTLSTLNVSVQLATPRWVVARAIALYQMAAFGGMAAGSWLFGVAVERHGVATALLLAAAWQFASLLHGFAARLPGLENANLDPGEWEPPVTALPIEPRSGPIVTTIEYRIAPEDIERFLIAMHERHRIRRRDGARHWNILRDLMNEEIWVERYHVATWTDYLRHNHRRTHADAENSRQIFALHRGDKPPVVHRRIEWQTLSEPSERTEAHEVIAEPVSDVNASA
ncbi:MAG: MFS transporter [Sphingomonadales bacterium]